MTPWWATCRSGCPYLGRRSTFPDWVSPWRTNRGWIWTKGFGYANREQGTPFTANTRSNIASVSKQFTCAAVMKLMEEGRLEELTSGNTPPEGEKLLFQDHVLSGR
jgi:hypothetical protein